MISVHGKTEEIYLVIDPFLRRNGRVSLISWKTLTFREIKIDQDISKLQKRHIPIFVFLVETGVSPCWPGCSGTPGLRR